MRSRAAGGGRAAERAMAATVAVVRRRRRRRRSSPLKVFGADENFVRVRFYAFGLGVAF